MAKVFGSVLRNVMFPIVAASMIPGASGTPTPTPTPVTSAAVTGDLIDRHNVSVGNGNVYQANEDITLPVSGSTLRVVFAENPGILDLTKIKVHLRRVGFNPSTGAATTVDEIVNVNGVQRRAFPNQTSPYSTPGGTDPANTYYFSMESAARLGDVITSVEFNTGLYTDSTAFSVTSVANDTTLAYDQVPVGVLTQPFARVTGTHQIEILPVDAFGRDNRTVARVEAWFVDKDGVLGTVAASTVMERSDLAPVSGNFPSGLPFASFKLQVPITKRAGGGNLADGEIRLYWKVYPFIGSTAWESAVVGADWPSFNVTKYTPFGLDTAGTHSPVYAWWNQNNTAGASPAVQTTSADPGSVAGYASPAAAAAAIRVYNNARGHDDCSGGVIMLRDVAGSTYGSDTGSYQQVATWGSTTTYPAGMLGVTVRRASDPLTPSQLCRLRSITGAASSTKQICSIATFEGITLDALNKASADNIVVSGGGPTGTTGSTVATGAIFRKFRDCDFYESQSASGANRIVWNCGWAYELRSNWVNSKLGWQAQSNNYSGLVASIGSANTGGAGVQCPLVVSFYTDNGVTVNDGRGNYYVPLMDAGVWAHIYAEGIATAGSRIFNANSRSPIRKCWGILNCFTKTVTSGSTGFGIANDGNRGEVKGLVMLFCGGDGDGGVGRANVMYQDQGFTFISKRATMKYCVFSSFNTKGECFIAPETQVGSTWTADTEYYVASVVHDGNATAGNRVYYCAKVDHISGATLATDLADTAKWRNLGQVNGVVFGQQPLRTGTLAWRNGVDREGNVLMENARGDTVYGTESWFGDLRGKNEVINVLRTDCWVSRDVSALGELGDYRAKAGGPLVNKVLAGMCPYPLDMAGNTRYNDGTGAAGPWERAA